MIADGPPVTEVTATAYTVPTDAPEADGTASWDATTIIVVHTRAGGRTGLGYTYADASILDLIARVLAPTVKDVSALAPETAWDAMRRRVRNLGREGLAATAMSAIDVALWDLKARLLDLPLAALLGIRRDTIPVYGSGGFTSYDDSRLADQLAAWVERDGCRWVKMKIGSEPWRDPQRVAVARRAIGPASLFVDANGAFEAREAVDLAARLAADYGVSYFEEPVSSDDLAGMRFVRDHAPPSMAIAAGEYGYTSDYFRAMLASGAVDIQQADASRCGGITGFRQAAALCDAFHTSLSAHCAPALHVPLACSVPRFKHQEWFYDHARIERIFFEGAPTIAGGVIRPDHARSGLGLTLRAADVEQYRVTS